MNRIVKILIISLLGVTMVSACSTVPYDFDELNTVDYSIITTEKGFLKNKYGYYKSGELVHFDSCTKSSWDSPFECNNEDGTIVLKYEANAESNFDSPTLTINDKEYNLICDMHKDHGKYCIIEK